MTLKKKIENLLKIVQKEQNEKNLILKGEEILNSLRNEYIADKDDFSAEDIKILKTIADQIDSVHMFRDEIEEFPYFEFKEDIDDAINRLFPIIETTEGLLIVNRVKKEIRGLIEKRQLLPNQSEIKNDRVISNAMIKLEANSGICKKCGGKMVVRKGKNDYFWGCSNFPNCWYKSPLKKEELNILEVQ